MYTKALRKLIAFAWAFLTLSSIPSHAQAVEEYVTGLTMQAINSVSIEDIELGLNYQLANLNKSKEYTLKAKVYSNEDQLLDALHHHELIAYYGSPFLFLKNKDYFDVDYLFCPILNNQPLQRYFLLVRKDSAIEKIEHLKNKTLSYSDADEVGIVYLNNRIKEKKLGQFDTFFNRLLNKKNSSLAISAVFFKESQAALVLENDYAVASELNPQLKNQLTAVEISPAYITSVLALSKDMEGPLTKPELETYLLPLSSTMHGKKMLQAYHYGAMKKIKSEDLNSVKDLISSPNENRGFVK